MKNRQVGFAAAIFFALILGIAAPIVLAQQPPRPPEYPEIMAAQRITDAAARLKEFERLKGAYPQSSMMEFIDTAIRVTKIEMCTSLDEILALQKPVLGKGEGFDRLISYLDASSEITSHPLLGTFDKAGVIKAILTYKDEVAILLKEEAFLKSIPKDERPYLAEYQAYFRVDEAVAQLNADDPAKALAALDAYKAEGGLPEARSSFTAAEALAKSGKDAEALANYMDAAVENYKGAVEKARDMWLKVNGSADGFEAAFETKQKELPYHPEEFKAPADGKGKTVLAEIFTGSECPPCVGADLGFDGLLESIPATYLAILEYHLPIPRPDPMINPATQFRAQYYAVRGTPSTYFDGEDKAGGGSGRMGSVNKYKEYLAEINPRLSEVPALVLTAKAVRAGDIVTVDVTLDKPADGAEINVVLVEKEVAFKGGNGIAFHKMVVRDMKAVKPESPQITFDLGASEKATDEYMTEFEKTYTRIPNYKFPVRYNKIGRDVLKIVVFVQDKATKKVLNAVSVDIK
ncbi:MAG: hypothetical protein ACYDH3_02375 [Candidatus Aminicenantales bacterium]